jgi:AcrR family transcriptional regulator
VEVNSKSKKTHKQRRERARTAILKATLETLREGKKISLQKIAQKAKVSKSLIFYHFSTKTELLLMAQDYFFHNLLKEILDEMEEEDVEGAFSALDKVWDSIRENPNLLFLLLIFAQEEIQTPRFGEEIARHFDELRGLIVEGMKRLLPKESFPQEQLWIFSEILFLILLGLNFFTPVTHKKINRDEVYTTFKEIARIYLLNKIGNLQGGKKTSYSPENRSSIV